jgi:hypothetical protein
VEHGEHCLLKPEALRRAQSEGALRDLQRRLIKLRGPAWQPGTADAESVRFQVFETQNAIAIHYRFAVGQLCVVLNLSEHVQDLRIALAAGLWEVLIDSGSQEWGGRRPELHPRVHVPGLRSVNVSPRSLTLLQRLNDEN